MTAKEIRYAENARIQLLGGLDALAHVVKATLGPRSKNVVLDRPWGTPTITMDAARV